MLVQESWHLKGLFFPCQNPRQRESWKYDNSPELFLRAATKHANTPWMELLKRITALVLLACPFQFGRWGQGPAEATLQCLLAECGCWENTVILIKQKCPSHFKSSCYFQGWQAKPPREACICEQTSHLCVSSHQTGKGISSVRQEGPRSVGLSQMGGQEGKCEVIVQEVLSCERAKYNIFQTEDSVWDSLWSRWSRVSRNEIAQWVSKCVLKTPPGCPPGDFEI